MSKLLPRRFKPEPSTTMETPHKVPPAETIRASHDGSSTSKPGSYSSHPNASSSDTPVYGNFSSAHLTLAGGVAIFHLATSRVVLCYHSRECYYFLPKGRKDMNEALTRGAEREGYEESGYHNRLLPLPIPHRQPRPHHPESGEDEEYFTEAIWVQLAPVTRMTQYMLFWYVAETVPPAIEVALTAKEKATGGAYQTPPPFEKQMTIQERISMEGEGYEPTRHENTGVDEDEAHYMSSLVTIEEAIEKLGRKSISADVVRKGWEAIEKRREVEEARLQAYPREETGSKESHSEDIEAMKSRIAEMEREAAKLRKLQASLEWQAQAEKKDTENHAFAG